MRMKTPILFLILTAAFTGGICSGCRTGEDAAFRMKINGMPALDERGLQGPPDGLRTWAYEFCIPDRQACREAVLRIEPDLKLCSRAPGRARCGAGLLLCIGETGPDWKKTLSKLAALEWIEKIQPCYYE